MQNSATENASPLGNGRPSMAESVARLRMEFSNIRAELQVTKSENNRLKDELDEFRSKYEALPNLEVPKLRRCVTFYCHPDRGGDDEIMSKLNVLFDFLASVQTA